MDSAIGWYLRYQQCMSCNKIGNCEIVMDATFIGGNREVFTKKTN